MSNAVLGRASVTIYKTTDVKRVVMWYKLVLRTEEVPTVLSNATESDMLDAGWTRIEPNVDSTKKLYTVIQNIFGDDSYTFNTDVSLSSTYEAAIQAKTIANDKNSVYYSSTQPTGNSYTVNDLWFNTGNSYKMSKWNGTTWVPFELGTNAISDLSITSAKIANGAVGNAQIGTLDAGKITTGTLSAIDIEVGKAENAAGVITVYDENNEQKVLLDKNGIVAAGGSENVNRYILLDSSNGMIKAASGISGGIMNGDVVTIESGVIRLERIQTTDAPLLTISPNGIIYSYSATTDIVHPYFRIDPSSIVVGSDLLNADATAVVLTGNEISIIDPENPQLETGIARWSLLSSRRQLFDTLYVTVYHNGNMFWAHFDGTIPDSLSGSQTAALPIIINDDNLSNSSYCAPPSDISHCLEPFSSSSGRPIIKILTTGQIKLYTIINSTDGTNFSTTTGEFSDGDVFWAHI